MRIEGPLKRGAEQLGAQGVGATNLRGPAVYPPSQRGRAEEYALKPLPVITFDAEGWQGPTESPDVTVQVPHEGAGRLRQ